MAETSKGLRVDVSPTTEKRGGNPGNPGEFGETIFGRDFFAK